MNKKSNIIEGVGVQRQLGGKSYNNAQFIQQGSELKQIKQMQLPNRVYETQQVQFQRCSCLKQTLLINKSQPYIHSRLNQIHPNQHSSPVFTPSRQKHISKVGGLKLSKNICVETPKKQDLCSTAMNTLCKTSLDNYDSLLPQSHQLASPLCSNKHQFRKQKRNIFGIANNMHLIVTQSQLLDSAELQIYLSKNTTQNIKNEKDQKAGRDWDFLIVQPKQVHCRVVIENNKNETSNKNFKNAASCSTLFQTKNNIQDAGANGGESYFEKENESKWKKMKAQGKLRNERRFDNHPQSWNIQDFSRVREVETVMQESFSVSFLDVGSGILGDSFLPELIINQKEIEKQMKRLLSN